MTLAITSKPDEKINPLPVPASGRWSLGHPTVRALALSLAVGPLIAIVGSAVWQPSALVGCCLLGSAISLTGSLIGLISEARLHRQNLARMEELVQQLAILRKELELVRQLQKNLTDDKNREREKQLKACQELLNKMKINVADLSAKA